MVYQVDFAPQALDDLKGIFDYIAADSSPRAATSFVNALTLHSLGLADFPSRGSPVGSGVRFLVFRKRATIAYIVEDDTVTVLRVRYAGLDWRPD